MSRAYSAALPIAYVLLRVLIVLNWLSGAAIVFLLVAMPTRNWIMSTFGIPPSPEADRLILGLRTIAVVGLAAIPLNHVVLKRLLAIVETVRAGDPFVAAIARAVSTPAHPLDVDGFSISGWLAVLLTFLLARVFAEGALLREDVEGTV
jgi:hypothetical protein